MSPALNDSDGVTGFHPQSTWLCDLPHTASLRKPSLLKQPFQVGKARPVCRVWGPAAQGEGVEGPGTQGRLWQPGSVLLQSL